MKRQELVEALAGNTDNSKAGAERNVVALIEIITATLKKGDKLALVAFGTSLVCY